jgi:predicted DNA-binding protein with PD1-like motif
MKHARLSDTTYALRLERGEDIHTTVQDFCSEHGINNASLTGIGSVENAKLAHYSVKTKQFTERHLDGIFEITSLLGNVGLLDGKPLNHVHVTLSDSLMQVYGGHLVSGECSATAEIFLHEYDTKFSKAFDDGTGLNVWQFEE